MPMIPINLSRVFLRSIKVLILIMILHNIYHSQYNLPMFYYIPGTSINKIFDYSVNLVVQTCMYFAAMEEVMGSDAFIMIMIMYCNSELRTIEDLITQVDGKDMSKMDGQSMLTIYKVHQAISQKTQKLTQCFWHVYFQKFFSIMIYFCVVLFIFRTTDFPILLVLLISLIVTQIFILCYSGQFIMNSAEDMAKSLYMIKWYELSVQNQKALLMLMIGLQHPIKVETFGFGIISFNTFVQVFCFSFILVIT